MTNRPGTQSTALRKPIIGLLIVMVLLIAGITVLSSAASERSVVQTPPLTTDTPKPQKQKAKRNKYVTRTPQGETVVVDRETATARPITAKEAKRLAEGLKQLINNNGEGLVSVDRGDGTVSIDLEGRFQNVMLARVEEDGSVSEECVDNLEAAAAFFEIDPALVGVRARQSITSRTRPPIK